MLTNKRGPDSLLLRFLLVLSSSLLSLVFAAFLTWCLIAIFAFDEKIIIASVATLSFVAIFFSYTLIARQQRDHESLGKGLAATMNTKVDHFLRGENAIKIVVPAIGSSKLDGVGQVEKHLPKLHDPDSVDELLKIYLIIDVEPKVSEEQFRGEGLEAILDYVRKYYNELCEEGVIIWFIVCWAGKFKRLARSAEAAAYWADQLSKKSGAINSSEYAMKDKSVGDVLSHQLDGNRIGLGFYIAVINSKEQFRHVLLWTEIVAKIYNDYHNWRYLPRMHERTSPGKKQRSKLVQSDDQDLSTVEKHDKIRLCLPKEEVILSRLLVDNNAQEVVSVAIHDDSRDEPRIIQ